MTNKKNSIIIAIVAAIALAIGIVLLPVAHAHNFAVVLTTAAGIALTYALYNLAKIIIAAAKENGNKRKKLFRKATTFWRDLVLLLTFIGVIIVIMMLARGCVSVNVDRVNEIGRIDEIGTIGEIGKIDEIEKIDEIDKVNEIEKVDEIDKVKEIEKIDEIDKVKEIEKIDEIDKVKEIEKIGEIENVKEPAETEATTKEPAQTEATTKEPAETTHVCKVVNTVKIDATCTKNGYIRGVCSCGKTISETVIEATGHDWNNGKTTKEATEDETGVKTYTCKKCGATKSEKIDKIEHVCKVYDTIEVDATCTKAGYIREVCSCGEILFEKKIKATGHDYEVVGERKATATKDGYIKYRCTNCGDTYKDVIPATGDDNEPVDDEFVITISNMKVVGNEFDEIVVYTSGNANDLVVLQGQKVFNYYVKDNHHLILTVGDEDTYAKVYVYDPAHEDKPVEVRRLSPVDPMA